MPEVLESGVVQKRRGLEALDMPAKFRGGFIGPQHDGERVPADDRTDAVLDGAVAGMRRLLVDRDGVEVGRVGRVGDRGALTAGAGPPPRGGKNSPPPALPPPPPPPPGAPLPRF